MHTLQLELIKNTTKMYNNLIFSDSFMQFLCIINTFYASFMHKLYAYFHQFVNRKTLRRGQNITGIYI